MPGLAIAEPNFVDLHKSSVFGFEDDQNPQYIEVMIAGILRGDVFPRVPVILSEEEYFLTTTIKRPEGMPDGGHHRAIAHYLADVPMRVSVYPAYGIPYNRGIKVAIAELALKHEWSLKQAMDRV